MKRWLFKTDPETYSWQDLVKVKKEVWDGVANPLALKHLRAAAKGDAVFIYHTGAEKSVMGIGRILSAAYASAGDASGKPSVIDLEAREALKRPVSLAEIKSHPGLAGWELVRFSRLSVMPVSEVQWETVLALSRKLPLRD